MSTPNWAGLKLPCCVVPGLGPVCARVGEDSGEKDVRWDGCINWYWYRYATVHLASLLPLWTALIAVQCAVPKAPSGLHT